MQRIIRTTLGSPLVRAHMKEIAEEVTKGKTFEQMWPRKYTKAVESFGNAAQRADTLLKKNIPLLPEHREDLAKVYAHYARAITNYKPSKIPEAQEAIKKSLALDATNPIANELNLDINLDEYLTSPGL